MKIYGIDLSILIIALITAFFGYQFNHRAKRKELFLKELANSYNEIYFPMHELLQKISNTEEKLEKHSLIDAFFEKYSGIQAPIRFIGSSFLLDYYYELREKYRLYKKEQTRTNEHELLKKIEDFKIMVDDEFWNSHDIIYEDHIQFINDNFKNPFIVLLLALARLMYYLSVFSIYLALAYLYFALWNKVVSIESFPKWWTIKDAILLVTVSVMIYGCMMSIKSFAIKRNRRKSKLIKRMKTKLVALFQR